ncbi:hypothetical protein ABT344_11180 [Micromonospora carbonacea]|uniref:hypothetical protein n=1 Tax=Micromonospora carbonacea TaxID=47853 RepID=UPI00332CCC3F
MSRFVGGMRRLARQTYGPVMWRRLARVVTGLPQVGRALASRRFGRGLLAVPIALANAALTATLLGLTFINVAYPLRRYIGLGGNSGGGVWASTYDNAWGGPTLLGAWVVHGGGILLLVVPTLAWAIRGLLGVQERLVGARRAPARPNPPTPTPTPTPTPVSASVPAPLPAPRPVAVSAGRGTRGRVARRGGVVAAALLVAYAIAVVAHASGIGDNVLWLPRDLSSGAALAAVLAPVAAALAPRRWWRAAYATGRGVAAR